VADPDYRPPSCAFHRVRTDLEKLCGVQILFIFPTLKPSTCGPARRYGAAFNVLELGPDGGFADQSHRRARFRTRDNCGARLRS
jgi:hypothetical protein